MSQHRLATHLPAALGALLLTACGTSTADLPAVRDFHPARYLGVWYEIARLDHPFERGLEQVKAEYTENPDGTIRVVNQGRRDGREVRVEGKARLKDPEALTGELEVSFFGPFYGPYRILALTPDYTVALVTGGTRDYLWLLAREPSLDPVLLKHFLNAAEAWGFDCGSLIFPHQTGD